MSNEIYEQGTCTSECESPEELIRCSWNKFRDPPRKQQVGSAVHSKWYNFSIKTAKLITIFVVFTVVLCSTVISKTTMLLMVSQIGNNSSQFYCNKKLDINRQFKTRINFSTQLHWVWLLMGSYLVPEIVTWIRSIRICLFKSWIRPPLHKFIIISLMELCSVTGTTFLVFYIMPNIDAIRSVMLMNAFLLVPSIFTLFSKTPSLHLIIDTTCAVVQFTSILIWPVFDESLQLLPIILVLISFTWWQTFTSNNASIYIFRLLSSTELDNGVYFIYLIIIPFKSLIFVALVAGIMLWQHPNEEKLKFFLHHKSLNFFANNKINLTDVTFPSAFSQESNTTVTINDDAFPLYVWIINVVSTYVCYAFGKFACKVMIQKLAFALPLTLGSPCELIILFILFTIRKNDPCILNEMIPSHLFFIAPEFNNFTDYVLNKHLYFWPIWFISQIWLTSHIWNSHDEKLEKTEKLFVRPVYDAFFIDQSLIFNRRRNLKKDDKRCSSNTRTEDIEDALNSFDTPMIYACATMWHETAEEMMEFLKSIFRLDADQCAQGIVRTFWHRKLSSYYDYQTHIFFDDAFIREHQDDNNPQLNEYVKNFIRVINEAGSEVHETKIRIPSPQICTTPYGGRLTWTLPGQTRMIVHLKDRKLIRNKKRWSQVMYMYYLLGFKIMANQSIDNLAKDLVAQNTYILALDGDIDFQPEAVHLLVDYMKKNVELGAACGRIHPVGCGTLAWYQIFEYAVGHWLQKATEHVIGCVLCSPGCFSLFRAKALMDDGVLCRYAMRSSEAHHYIQYDQGEDRWLCTLLLQSGYRIEYSAASDAYTHCPEGFSEFYNQRRRWMPSTMANILDLLTDYKHIVEINDNVSTIYIVYQAVLFVGTILGPGTIFLMLVGAFVTVFGISHWTSLMWNLVPVLTFITVCTTCGTQTQLFFAALFSALYGLIMMAVFVGVILQINEDGALAPTSLFLFCVAFELIFAAFMHPQEIYCLKYGIIYFITVPSMYMLLVIFSVFNMNNVSWGTREITIVPQTTKKPRKKQRKKLISNKISTIINATLQRSLKGLFTRSKAMDIQEDDDVTEKLIPNGKEVVIESDCDKEDADPLINNENDHQNTSYTNENCWMYDESLTSGDIQILDEDENVFWEELLCLYLHPIEDDKVRVTKGLNDLRDKTVITFFMLNALFVLVIFILTLEKNHLHFNWPVAPHINFTYHPDINEVYLYQTYLELEPIGLVFLTFFAILLVMQFIGMLVHRFTTFSQILANTNIDFGLRRNYIGSNIENKIFTTNPLNLAYDLQKLRGINENDEDEPILPVSKRKTVHTLAKKENTTTTNQIYDLKTAFLSRLQNAEARKGNSNEHERRIRVIN